MLHSEQNAGAQIDVGHVQSGHFLLAWRQESKLNAVETMIVEMV